MYDVIIVGGGISGLSAGLILGRCRRNVLIIDNDKPRNGFTQALHGFITRDGTNPWDMRRIAREQLVPYTTVIYKNADVQKAQRNARGFTIYTDNGESIQSQFLVIATGLVDVLPEIMGIASFYGKSVFHCPYCDGWEHRDLPIAAYGQGDTGVEYALELTTWSKDIILLTDGNSLTNDQDSVLRRHNIGMRTEKIIGLEGEDGQLESIRFDHGDPLERKVLFFYPEQFQKSSLAESFGLKPEGGVVETGKYQKTQKGLYVIGDAAKSVQLAIVAAAEGTETAFAINTELQRAEWNQMARNE